MHQKLRFWFYRLFIIDCVGCGSLVVHSRGLCLKCETTIVDMYLEVKCEAQTLEKSELRFHYLFSWIPGASDTLSKYIYLLKSPLAEPLWLELAKYFLAQKGLPNHQNKVFVPIPSRKKRKHSTYFAQALADQLGGKVLQLLAVSSLDQLEQKSKNREQRQRISFNLCEEFTEHLRSDQMLVFVDDVITTGASYEAAYNVLKTLKVCPKNIELWAAFRREAMTTEFE